MKLIVDISEGILKNIDSIQNGSIGSKQIIKKVKNGTPLDDLKAEIDRQEKWLSQAGYTPYNVDIAFDSIKTVLKGANE